MPMKTVAILSSNLFCAFTFSLFAQTETNAAKSPLLLQVEVGRCAAGSEVCLVQEVLRKDTSSSGSINTEFVSLGSATKSIAITLNERYAIIQQIENPPPAGSGT